MLGLGRGRHIADVNQQKEDVKPCLGRGLGRGSLRPTHPSSSVCGIRHGADVEVENWDAPSDWNNDRMCGQQQLSYGDDKEFGNSGQRQLLKKPKKKVSFAHNIEESESVRIILALPQETIALLHSASTSFGLGNFHPSWNLRGVQAFFSGQLNISEFKITKCARPDIPWEITFYNLQDAQRAIRELRRYCCFPFMPDSPGVFINKPVHYHTRIDSFMSRDDGMDASEHRIYLDEESGGELLDDPAIVELGPQRHSPLKQLQASLPKHTSISHEGRGPIQSCGVTSSDRAASGLVHDSKTGNRFLVNEDYIGGKCQSSTKQGYKVNTIWNTVPGISRERPDHCSMRTEVLSDRSYRRVLRGLGLHFALGPEENMQVTIVDTARVTDGDRSLATNVDTVKKVTHVEPAKMQVQVGSGEKMSSTPNSPSTSSDERAGKRGSSRDSRTPAHLVIKQCRTVINKYDGRGGSGNRESVPNSSQLDNPLGVVKSSSNTSDNEPNIASTHQLPRALAEILELVDTAEWSSTDDGDAASSVTSEFLTAEEGTDEEEGGTQEGKQ